ncbi:MAG: M56 family metallopeptidase [Nonlabens sp.]|uniref:M56 family metallopeptidase n=1 Tax=Nonlabens sp. TaxID=1888209 RepID=UPI003EF961AC
MEQFVEYFLKSAGVLSIFVLVYHFLLRRLTFFQANRWFLIGGIIASMTFPLVEITQTVYVEQPVQEFYYVPQHITTPMAMVLEQPASPVETPFDYWQLLGFLYLTVVAFFLGKMVVELTSLFRLIKSGKTVKNEKFVMVTLSRKLTPFSFFNYICTSDTDEPGAALDVIMDHEKVHARQWHSIDVLLSHLYRAVFWMNPLAWWLKKQIGENLEFIADAEAKTQTKTGISYERTLLSSAAFHLQPSLANNFFTPFIKKRIMMLQKEASARWNMYKYALILPVIVVFLYSFNVVTEVEYVEVAVEEVFENDLQNQNESQQQVGNTKTNIGTSLTVLNNENENLKEDLVFDITAQTTDKELEKFAAKINDYANYQVRFSDQERDENKGLKRLSVATKFPGKKWNKNMTIGKEPFELVLVKVEKDKLFINDDSSKESIYVNEKGVHIEMEDWTYGDLNIEQTEDFKWKRANYKDVNIYIKITSASTKESLEEHKKWLKENHNVDFKYSKLRYKKGKLVAIKIELNDNDGSKISQTYKNKTAIPKICIEGKIDGDQKSWRLNNCEGVTPTTYQLGDVQYYNLNQDEYAKLTQMNLDSIIQNARLHMMDLDGLQNGIQLELNNINMDSIQNQLNIQFKNMNMDSIQDLLNNSILNLNTDSLVNYYQVLPDMSQFEDMDFSRFEIPNNLVSSNKYIIMGNPDGSSPLIIIDDKESDESVMNGNMDMSNIESMNVLKGKDATDLYGEKGNDGVIIITTKDGKGLKKLDRLEGRTALLNERREEMDSIRSDRREQMSERREELIKISEERKSEFEKRKEERVKLIHDSNVPYEIAAKNFIEDLDHEDAVYLLNDVIISRKEFNELGKEDRRKSIKMGPKISNTLLNDFYPLNENQYLVCIELKKAGSDRFAKKINKEILYRLNEAQQTRIINYLDNLKKIPRKLRNPKIMNTDHADSGTNYYQEYVDRLNYIRDPKTNKAPIYIIDGAVYPLTTTKDQLDASSVKNIKYYSKEEAAQEFEGVNDAVVEIMTHKGIGPSFLSENKSYLFPKSQEITSMSIEESDTLKNFNQAVLENYGEKVREKGYSFKIKTFKERNGKVVKLKIEFAGTDYAIATNKGIAQLTFNYFKDGSNPKMISVSN